MLFVLAGYSLRGWFQEGGNGAGSSLVSSAARGAAARNTAMLSCDIGSDSTAHGCQTGYVFPLELVSPL